MKLKIFNSFYLLIFVTILISIKLHAMDFPPSPEELPSEQEMTDEVSHLINETPTGFTFLFGDEFGFGVIVSCFWQLIRHPISSVKQIYNKACPDPNQNFEHKFEPSSQKKPSLLLTLTLDPIHKLPEFIDKLVIDDLPIIGPVSHAVKRFDGKVEVTRENCPKLYSMFDQTAHKLGCKKLERIYIFKGNSYRHFMESLGISNTSCQTGVGGSFTEGTSHIWLGRDLFLGVNPGQEAFIPGMPPEQIQALFAREVCHAKLRHPLKTFIVNASIAGLFTLFFINSFLDSIDLYTGGISLCIGAASYGTMREFITPLFTQSFSRFCEMEVDISALDALANPKAMADALSKLGYLTGLKRRPIAELWQNSPDLGTRINYLQREVLKKQGLHP